MKDLPPAVRTRRRPRGADRETGRQTSRTALAVVAIVTLIASPGWLGSPRTDADGRSAATTAPMIRLQPSTSGTADLQTALHHGFSIPLVAWRPDGRELAVVQYHGKTVRLWDTRTGSQSGQLHELDGQIETIAYSPDGERLATSVFVRGDQPAAPNLLLWDARGRKLLKRLIVPGGGRSQSISALVYSHDGRQLAVAMSLPHRTLLYDLARGVVTTELHAPANLGPMQIDPTGQLFAYASHDHREHFPLKIVRIADGATVTGDVTHAEKSLSLAFGASGRQLAVGDADGGVSLYDVRTGRVERRLPGHDGDVLSVRYVPRGDRLVSAAADGVRVWDVKSGVQIAHCRLGGPYFHRVLISPTGDQVVTGGPDELKVWTVCREPGNEVR